MGAAPCSRCEKAAPSAAAGPFDGDPPAKPRVHGLRVGVGGFGSFELVHDGRGSLKDLYDVDWQQQVGQGSFSSVHRCHNRETGQERAVKVIKRDKLHRLNQATQEINILKMMDHPNVLRLIETFEDKNSIELVTEFCGGGDVFDFIVDFAPVKDEGASAMAVQMLRAVAYLHSNTVIHRDLKAENWLFASPVSANPKTQNLDQALLKLCDFGCARALGPMDTARTKCGSPYYVAPEVLNGKYGHKADMWSLGVVMYMLLGAQPPIKGRSTEEVLENVKICKVHDEIKVLGAANGRPASSDAKAMVSRLLERAVEKRPTAQRALQDRWLVGKAFVSSQGVDAASLALDTLRDFAAPAEGLAGRLERAAVAAVTAQLDFASLRELERVFLALDTDGDGTVSCRELWEGLKVAGMRADEAEVRRLHARIDSDGSGAIDFSEFLAVAVDSKTLTRERACWKAAKFLDANGDGFLDLQDFKVLLLGDPVRESMGGCEPEVDDLFRGLDTNRDGRVSVGEFAALLRRLGRAGDAEPEDQAPSRAPAAAPPRLLSNASVRSAQSGG